MTGTISQICPFCEKKLFRLWGAVEREMSFMLSQCDSALHLCQLQIQDPAQLIAIETPKNHRFVDAIHEFRREFALRCVHGYSMNLAVDLFSTLVVRFRRETDPARRKLTHFSGAEIGRHENDRA